jgi:cell division protein FtsL
MSSTSSPSINVTLSRLSFALAVIAMLGIAWQAIGYQRDQEFRIIAIEAHIAEQKATNKELLAEIKQLSLTVTRLATVIEGSNVKREALQ